MTGGDVYAIPNLGRYGLAHEMLAWARCRLWCARNNATMLAPFWFKLRIGPYLRRERDKRNYFLLFQRGSAIGGLRRLALLARADRIEIGPEWPARPNCPRPTLLRFHNALEANDRKSFHQIVGDEALLRTELIAMTRRRFLPAPAPAPFIAVHVRLGDFMPATTGIGPESGTTNTRLPIDWYGNRLDAIREVLGQPIAAIIFSDGADEDLAPLLALPNVMRAPRQPSITDLLQIGHAAAVIASGSGFSMWGAFLGSAPRLSFPGQSRVPLYEDRTRDIESANHDDIPATFVAHVRARLKT